ncbi:hypothetical protein N658DRAFT_154937 [Parathielavia hyrcaniae]|uniref:Secreted protein n=1 Tax=Parathielavia hyrcaniae TaxID=113614 RepID=A0AAN6Q2K4_9PEZI|nr:hypothetical protein N658DRAFT_154937 [Parathielavia hyrcaniae]
MPCPLTGTFLVGFWLAIWTVGGKLTIDDMPGTVSDDSKVTTCRTRPPMFVCGTDRRTEEGMGDGRVSGSSQHTTFAKRPDAWSGPQPAHGRRRSCFQREWRPESFGHGSIRTKLELKPGLGKAAGRDEDTGQ